jgi:hypothetical protein
MNQSYILHEKTAARLIEAANLYAEIHDDADYAVAAGTLAAQNAALRDE